MKKSNNSCALFVGSCDAYADVLDPFFTLLKKYWPDLNYDIFLSTESTNYKHPDFKIKNLHPDNPNCSWTERIYDALKKIKAKQIFFVLDDFFLYDKVDSKKIAEIVNWLSKDPGIATFTLWNTPGYNKVSKYPGFDQRKKKANYKVAAIAGIWNKIWLKKYLKNHQENAWQFERNANLRTCKMLFPGKFFILQESPENIFPYNFAKFGLYSSRWMKETKKLFKDNHITADFKKRGWYNEKFSSASQSKIDAFYARSSILPCCYLKNRTTKKIYSPNLISAGPFRQIYHVKNGKNLFRWFISDINGYSISDLKINVVYQDGTKKPVDNKLIFGQFKKIDNLFVFNADDPTVFIVTEKEKIFKKIEITGKIIFPATKNHLMKSYKKITPPPNKYCEQIHSWFWFENLSCQESMTYIKMQPKITFDTKQYFNELPCVAGKFIYKYTIPKNAKTAVWTPSDSAVGYSIKNLRIKLINTKTNQAIYVQNPLITPQPATVKNWIILYNLKQIKFNVYGYDKIVITGNMKCAIKPRFLRKIIS